ncbi:hypothetical protein ABC3340 [Shouchella clausii KSM-K16]|uniref:Uncharacterized protein n=3 Tax=Shouchella TaxID=2893057 RepID=Q5WCN7_SHOC1|nr:hypothetical protein ABC3340 [Shouchella clausii KSM-K16]
MFYGWRAAKTMLQYMISAHDVRYSRCTYFNCKAGQPMYSFVLLLVLIAVLWYAYQKNKETFKQLSIGQTAGVFVAYGAAVAIIVAALYYVVQPVTEPIANELLKLAARFGLLIIVLFVCMFFLEKVLKKITNGAFPPKRR